MTQTASFTQFGLVWRQLFAALGFASLLVAPHMASAQSGGGPGNGGAGGGAGVGGVSGVPPLPTINDLAPQEVVRGSPITVTGSNLPPRDAIDIQLGAFRIGHPTYANSGQFIFSIPEKADTGNGTAELPIGPELLLRIDVTVDPKLYGVTTVPYTKGYIHIVSETRAPLKLTGLEPRVITPKTPELTLIGEGMGGPGADFTLLRDGREIAQCTGPSCTEPSLAGNSPFQIRFKLPAPAKTWPSDDWLGNHTISLRRGEGTVQDAQGHATAGIDVNVIEYSPLTIRVTAGIVAAIFLGLIGLIAIRGGGKRDMSAPGKPRAKVSSFLIDPATDTYSLSMLQFYLWSVAALVAYAYLTLSRALAQGHLDIADVPENLPGILAISAGTTVASIGVTALRGSKGAGDMPPKFSDLIGVGGAVAPERFQFLLWTFVAISAFLFYVFRTDPSVISDLPVIPPRLLMLSGISAAGYLGGKIARSPGPIIDEILATIGSLNLTILGSNLSAQAKVEIQKISATPFLDPATHPLHRPKGTDPEGDEEFCKMLELKLAAAPAAWIANVLEVTVTNPDGQMSTWTVSLSDATKALIEQLPRELPPSSSTPTATKPPPAVPPTPSRVGS